MKAEIEGLVRPVLHGVGKSAAQTVAVEPINRGLPVIPSVGNARRPGESLIVVEENPVVADVGQLIAIEKKLPGADLGSAGPFVAGVQISREWTVIITGTNLAAVYFTALVIER